MATVQFRDGEREVPSHVADLMTGIETYRLTFDEAMNKANAKMLSDYLDKTQAKIVSQHMEQWKRSG